MKWWGVFRVGTAALTAVILATAVFVVPISVLAEGTGTSSGTSSSGSSDSSDSSTTTYGGGSVSGYAAAEALDYGRIVVLEGDNADTVRPAKQSEVENMFGVTVDPQQIPMRVSREGIQNETYVAVSGTYNVLVSTQDGEIHSGDYLTLSSIDGVAMKAGDQEVTVFGRANDNFTGKDTALGMQTLKDDSGGTKTVYLGSIPVTIDIKNNPNHKSTKVNVPDFLEKIGRQIAEKEVSPTRLYISVGIAAVSLIASLAVLYAGVRNSVISIGRNPMSKRSIFRALIEVILTSLLILIVGLFAVYLLLKL